MDYEEVHVRQEVREFVRAAEGRHVSLLLTDEERDVLAIYAQTVAERYLALSHHPAHRDS